MNKTRLLAIIFALVLVVPFVVFADDTATPPSSDSSSDAISAPAPAPDQSVSPSDTPSETPADTSVSSSDTQAATSDTSAVIETPTDTTVSSDTSSSTASTSSASDGTQDVSTTSPSAPATDIPPGQVQLQTQNPTLSTDQPDYQPGSTATIVGHFFRALQSIALKIVGLGADGGNYTETTQNLTADVSGSFTLQYTLDGVYRPLYTVIASDPSTTQTLAETTFTDASSFSSVSVGSQSGVLTAGTAGSASYIVTVNRTGSGLLNVSLSMTGLPAGVTASTSSVSFTGNSPTSATTTLSVATTAGASAGTSTITVQGVGSDSSTKTTTGTLTIGAAAVPQNQTISFGSLSAKTYGNADFAVSATSTSGLSVTFTTAGACSNSGSTIHITSAGTCTVTAHQSGNGSYNAAPDVARAFTVNTKSVAVSSVSASNKSYDGTSAATITGCSLSGVLAADTANVTCSAASGSFADKNVGTGKTVTASGISLSGSAAGNYSLSGTSATTTANITSRAITVTAAANTKQYDGGTSASTAPTITSGTLASGDTANFTEAYTTKTVGTGKTLSPSGSVSDGNSGANYTVTFANSTAGVITAKALTPSVTANAKTYDGTNAATIGTCTLSGIIAPDVVTCSAGTAAFADKSVGTNKTVTASGITLGGADAGNYSLSSTTATANANITARPLTVTAQTNTKTYDGGTTASASPTITSGSLATGDTANFTESYDNKNVGTGKTLTPSGSVSDGNTGNNYAITFATNTSGSITAKSVTASVTANNKTYDGGTTATITNCSLSGVINPDVVTCGATSADFSNKNVGTGKTVTASGISLSGAGAGNYTLTSTTATTNADITVRAITVTAQSNAKTYDHTTDAAAVPTITNGTLATGDSANFTESYDTKNVGTGKTLTPGGSISDGNGGANYEVTFSNDTTGIITAQTVTASVTAEDKGYDGDSSATIDTCSVNGVINPDVVTCSVGSASFDDKNVGTGKTVTASGITLDGADAGNYALSAATATTTNDITQRAITVTAQTNTKVYDGSTSASATPTITSGSLATGDTANFTETYDTPNAGTGKTLTATGSVDDGNSGANYSVTFQNDTSGVITPAPATVTLSGLIQIYNGLPRSVGVTTAPVGLGVAVTYDGHVAPPTEIQNYAVEAHVTDPNYTGSATDTLQILVNKPNRGVVVSGSGNDEGAGNRGQVLGAATSTIGEGGSTLFACSEKPYLAGVLSFGRRNDPNEVKKLQTFLNIQMNAGLPITGFYGARTRSAVKAFQTKYADKVLDPWKAFGGSSAATGNVGKLTLWWIDTLACPATAGQAPQLP
jgi:hypothetical protein